LSFELDEGDYHYNDHLFLLILASTLKKAPSIFMNIWYWYS